MTYTATASNNAESITVSMEGVCDGCNLKLKLAIRQTTDGRSAIISATPRKDGTYRLVKLFASKDNARRYLAACN